jgi:hypothetical protein
LRQLRDRQASWGEEFDCHSNLSYQDSQALSKTSAKVVASGVPRLEKQWDKANDEG